MSKRVVDEWVRELGTELNAAHIRLLLRGIHLAACYLQDYAELERKAGRPLVCARLEMLSRNLRRTRVEELDGQ